MLARADRVAGLVVIRLMGGLGNQLFQYAAARRLAHVTQSDLLLDLSALDNFETPRSYALKNFQIKAEVLRRHVHINSISNKAFMYPEWCTALINSNYRVIRISADLVGRRFSLEFSLYRDTSHAFSESFNNLVAGTFLIGY